MAIPNQDNSAETNELPQPWQLLESDPAIFTCLLRDLGVEGGQVEEVVSLDEEMLRDLGPAYGLIFLFRWTDQDTDETELDGVPPKGMFFANQVTDNACATQALLSVVLNSPQLRLSRELEVFKEFCEDITPPFRGLALANHSTFRKAHNSFARVSPLPFREYSIPHMVFKEAAIRKNKNVKKPKNKQKRSESPESDENGVYHFISFMPFDGKVWEVDGLKRAPILLGNVRIDNEWLMVALPAIRKRMDHNTTRRYVKDEITFSLMAIVQSKELQIKSVISDLNGFCDATEEKLQEIKPDWRTSFLSQWVIDRSAGLSIAEFHQNTFMSMEAIKNATADQAKLLAAAWVNGREKLEVQHRLLEEEKTKVKQYENANDRRRHNLDPFIQAFLRKLGDEGRLKQKILE
ncbi:ubiquitin carboxyl-terminal hydrolase [Cladochytrium replicatum]|nr:ubiquitin carboxyl-terminal hydrolase [Cladochytrium replicatum]